MSVLAASSQTAAIQIEGLSKSFNGARVLHGLTLDVEPGRIHALLGENGSGKSTVIKVLSGFHTPDPGGAVRVAGETLEFGSAKASVAAGLRFVHQHSSVILEMNAMENLALEAGYTRNAYINWSEQEDYTRRALARINVDMDVHRPLRECRALERSAVAIVRALRASEGEAVHAVILDEPTASLPEAEVGQLLTLLRDVAAAGVAVVYVSHRLDEVFELADRVSVLRDGRLVGTRAVKDITRGDLVNLIVGTELAEDFENVRRGRTNDAESDVLLRVERLRSRRIRQLSFTVAHGEVVGVAGIGGSGREDLARALIGAAIVEDGEIELAGARLYGDDPREAREAGMVLALSNTQPDSAVAAFSIRENVTLPALGSYKRGTSIKRSAERRAVMEWIKSLDIRPPIPDMPYATLSGGNQQKVILGRWLNCAPKVLLLDEPTAGVDVGARRLIYQLILDRADAGMGVVICSSDLEDIVSVSDRVLVLRDGVLVAELTGSDISESTLLKRAHGDRTIDEAGPIKPALEHSHD
jgi:ribose transport system ATP-binding protein